MASTLDNISRGRLELGIGAGWFRDEHLAFGFDWNKHSARIERLRETIEIIKRLWAENQVSYDGKYFQLKDATLEPKPLQKPCPVWVGGNSGDIRKVVAELGDGWIPALPTQKQLAHGVVQIKHIMKNYGRDPKMLQVAYGGSGCALIAENEESVKDLAEPLIRSMKKPEEESACLIGTPTQCIQKIEQYQKAGAQKIVTGFYDFPSLRGLQLFARSVIPHFKNGNRCTRA